MARPGLLFQIHFVAGEQPQAATPRLTELAPAPAKASDATGIVTIGRSPHCDHAIDSPLVSREHARLVCDLSGVVIEDLNSTNGTFINGQRLAGQARLHPGDRVAIATFAFVFTGEALDPVDTAGRVRVEVRSLYKAVADRSAGQRRITSIKRHSTSSRASTKLGSRRTLRPSRRSRITTSPT